MINNYVFTSVNAYTIGRSFVLSLSLFLCSCLDFGDDIELVGAEITGKEINYVSEITGLTLPDGTEPVGYYFLGSGIDRKIELPKAKYLECTVGLEDGKIHAYVRWFEI